MGKKAKSKKRRYKYSKQEFIALCCEKCTLCNPGVEPSFCYGKIYVRDPKLFISNVFKELMEFKHALYNEYCTVSLEPNSMIKLMFQEAFCDSKICREYKGSIDCPEITQCLFEFTKQLNGVGTITTACTKSSKHKKNNRQVYEPYATFFCNSKFEQTVKEILNNNANEGVDDADADNEQDKVEECTSKYDGVIDQPADNPESEIPGSTNVGTEYVQNTTVHL